MVYPFPENGLKLGSVVEEEDADEVVLFAASCAFWASCLFLEFSSRSFLSSSNSFDVCGRI